MEGKLWINSLQREEYEEANSTTHTHNGLSLKPYGSITLFILVGPRAMHTTFDVILEFDLFRMKLGVPWLASMNMIAFVIHKCLKFSHEGVVLFLHDTRY